MDKAAIERFAIASRKKLRNSVSLKMTELGANPEYPMKVDVIGSYLVLTDPNNGIERHLSSDEAKARDRLLQVVSINGFDSVVESVAYTWFNRLIAVRYMEVNNYLPSHIRVLSSITPGKKEPDLVTHCLTANINLTSSEKETVIKYQNQGRFDDLFKIMFLAQCKDLGALLPELFTKTNSYENLLFDTSYTNPEGVIRDLVDNIPEDDFKDAVQIIGWMYQYYNTELKNDTFAQLKKNVKIPKDRIPSATQLFTPDWIVRYMVENSVGRIWLDGHPDEYLKKSWEYYLDEAEQESSVQDELSEIFIEHSLLSPEDITIIDPCMGSGHILVYAFDVLMQIYESYGYSREDAATLIVEKNLYGLDIDDRAYQLAYFAVMMKYRQYNSRALDLKTKINICSIPDSTTLDNNVLDDYVSELKSSDASIAREDLKYLISHFKQGKIIGSLLKLKSINYDLVKLLLTGHTTSLYSNANTNELLKRIVQTATLINKKYSVVITNPPYMGSTGMNKSLLEYIKDNYSDSKSDLFACFIERCMSFQDKHGYVSMITQQSFMFQSSFDHLRKKILNNRIVNFIQLGAHAFNDIGGEVVQTASFVIQNYYCPLSKGTYIKLNEGKSELEKQRMFFDSKYLYFVTQNIFDKIPGRALSFWADEFILNYICSTTSSISDYGIPLQGTISGDNDRFMRFWFEVSKNDTKMFSTDKDVKWYSHSKGGKFRRWYGNREYVLNWQNDGYDIRNNYDSSGKLKSRPQNISAFFHMGINWSDLTTGQFSARLTPENCTFDATGPTIPLDNRIIRSYMLGYMNSKIFQSILDLTCYGLHYNNGIVAKLPCVVYDDILHDVVKLVEDNISLVKEDWDLMELSYEFMGFKNNGTFKFLEDYIDQLLINNADNIVKLKNNEEKINLLFMQKILSNNHLSINIPDEELSIKKLTAKQLMIRFVSYSVGVMFGRYSLDEPGLCYAGGHFDQSLYFSFIPDANNVIPINDEEYFGDDIVTYFCNFLQIFFGKDYLEDNLKYVANSLEIKGPGTSRDKIRKYFLNDFYKDHIQMYQKCPIYWLFDSGKANGFKALVYIHRYTPDLIGRMRKEYLHRIQRLYNDQMSVESDQVRRTSLQKKLDEISRYDLAMELYALKNIEIDLDDGIKHNYALFQNIENSKAVNDKINLLYKI